MVLESTIICVDNSQFMRNGDFHPTRLQAQQVFETETENIDFVLLKNYNFVPINLRMP